MDDSIQFIMVLPGKTAKEVRQQFSVIIRRHFAGDQSLHDEIDANATSSHPVAQMARESLGMQGPPPKKLVGFKRRREELELLKLEEDIKCIKQARIKLEEETKDIMQARIKSEGRACFSGDVPAVLVQQGETGIRAGASEPEEQERMPATHPTRQFRFVEARTASRPSLNPSVKYLAVYPMDSGRLAVLAQGKDKFTLKKWAGLLRVKQESLSPVDDMKAALEYAGKQVLCLTKCLPFLMD